MALKRYLIAAAGLALASSPVVYLSWPALAQSISPVVLYLSGSAVSSGNPLPVSGTVTSTNASIGPTGSAVPGSATYLGINNSGNLVGWVGDTTNGGYVNVTKQVPALGITPTDRTITSASGASQQIMASNTGRHSLTIQNTGNANCGVNPTGGTAAIGGAGTLTLVPNGSYSPRVPTLSAVTVICTAGQPIYGAEN